MTAFHSGLRPHLAAGARKFASRPAWITLRAVAAAICTALPALAQVTAFRGNPAPDTTRTDAFQAGWGFYATTAGTKQVNRLGVWVAGAATTVNHDVALYNYTGATPNPYALVVQATVPSGSTPDANGYAWVAIPPVTLTDTRQGGDYYIVMARVGTDAWGPNTGYSHAPTLDISFGTPTTRGFYKTDGGFTATESFNPTGLYGGYFGPNLGFEADGSYYLYWKGATDGTWNGNLNNWTSDEAGIVPATAFPDALHGVFFTADGATNLNTTLGDDFSVGGVKFTTASAVTIGGGHTLAMGSEGITVASGSGAHTVNCALAVGGNQTWANESGNPLTVNGALSGSGAVAFNGGTTILAGDNSARPAATTGMATVNAGTVLQLQANAGNTAGGISYALSAEQTANQPLIVNNGGTLQLRSDGDVTFAGGNSFGGLGSASVTIDVNQLTAGNSDRTITLAPGGFNTGNTTINVEGGNGYTLNLGNVLSGATMSLAFNANTANLAIDLIGTSKRVSALTVGGAANTTLGTLGDTTTGAGTTLTKIGTGTLTISRVNGYRGKTTVSGGTLRLAATDTLNPVSGIQLNGGTLDCGALTNHLGTLTVADGVTSTLRIDTGGALSFADSSAITWTGDVNIEGTLDATSLRFGNSGSALTPSQVRMMRYNSFRVDIDANGYIFEAPRGTRVMFF